MIEIRNLSRRYGSVWALKNVSMRVEAGSVVGLLGQNGAGKTTLLNILTGYLAPTEGSVWLDGYDPLLEPAAAKRHLGYLPEHPPLYDEMTVQEYLSFVAELKCVERRAIPAHVEDVMTLTGLLDMRRRLVGHLSKGYRQRVGMAQALCGDPGVLVLDEPTVGLDPKQITEVRALIRRLAKGRTIVFSSHILSEVQQLCDHVIILDQGQVRLDAGVAEMNDPEETTLRCVMAAEERSLLGRLRRLDGVHRVECQPCVQEGRVDALITFRHVAEPERRLYALLSSMNVPILHLSRCENSLEQVFLATISQ